MIRRLFALVLLLSLALVADDAMAQRKSKAYLKKRNRQVSRYTTGSIHFDRNKKYLAVGLNANAMNYLGDIVPASGTGSFDISFTKPGGGLFAYYRFHPNMFVRTAFNWGRIKGDDFTSADPTGEDSRYRYVRNAHFRNDIKELSLTFNFDLLGNHGTFLNRVRFTPYVFAGVAGFHHNPKAVAPNNDKFGNPLPEATKWVELQPLGTEGQFTGEYDVEPYKRIQVAFPAGLGVRALLSKRLDLEFEVGYRFLLTDYLDDVSGLYVDLGAFRDNELAKAMSDRTMEQTSALTGDPRDFQAINNTASLYTYTSAIDGQQYTTYRGYGHEHPDNVRGRAGDRDIYIMTSIKLVYILTGKFQRAKFR
jgi:hypothetical protein